MLKKGLSLIIVLIMLTSMLMACDSADTTTKDDKTTTTTEKSSEENKNSDTTENSASETTSSDNWKIGIITGTVTQNEEEYRAAEAVLAKYGAEHVILQTYPDRFMDEQETVISNITGVASDPDVKALVICQAVPGTSAAIDKIKETRDDLLIIAGTSGEDPNMIAARADVCFQMDEIGMGTAVPEQAKKLGAEVFVHYSFPRHMSYALLAARRDIMKEKCEELGLQFVDATAPDPTGDAGTAGAQQFILEDVPKMIAQYGKNTAFFSTNCAMQQPLIKASFDEGAIYPQPCCPSPYHGFPAALEIDVEGHQGDIPYILDEISKKYAEAGISGRASTWPVPVNMMYIEGGADYAVKWINGDFEEKLNQEEVIKSFNSYVEEVTSRDDIELKVAPLVENEKEFDNYLMVLCDFYDF